MRLIGRNQELETLELAHGSSDFAFWIVSGRRRVGKNSLLHRFAADKRTVFFTAVEANKTFNLVGLSRAYSEVFLKGEPVLFPDFSGALEAIFDRGEKERLLFVIEEYPSLAKADPSFAEALRRMIDLRRDRSKLMLVLSGSSVSNVRDEVLADGTSLGERVTGELQVEPLDFFDAVRLLEASDTETAALLYGMTGGTPRYLEKLRGATDLKESVRKLWLEPDGFFVEEVPTYLKLEVLQPETYFSALAFMAEGAERLTNIAAKVGKDVSTVLHALNTMERLGIVGRETPFGTTSSRRSRYRITENSFRFWFTFVLSSLPFIRTDASETLFRRIEPRLAAYMEPVFTVICRQYLQRLLACAESPVRFSELGCWWGNDPWEKKEASIDIVGEESSERALFAQCRWTDVPVDVSVLKELDLLSRRLFPHPERHLFLFAKSAFSDDCHAYAARIGNVRLVTLDEMARRF